ncbi:MAG: shikimate kinase [Mucinivorans sp.]
MKIYLVGFMGSGKSTLGAAMAQKLNYSFVDLDHYIVEKEGRTIAEIFADPAKGERYFRECEKKYLSQASQEAENIIISTGGGTPTVGDNMSYMKTMGTVVYLKTDPELLCERLLKSKTVRPLVLGKSPDELLEYIKNTLDEREQYYTQANIVISNAGRQADRVIELINYKY